MEYKLSLHVPSLLSLFRNIALAGSICLAGLTACGGGGQQASAAPEMKLFVGRLGGAGNLDGTPGRFMQPVAVATDQAGNVYVNDQGGIRKVTPEGAVTTLAAISAFGAASIAVDKAGNLYWTDIVGNVVRKTAQGGETSILAGAVGAGGAADGVGDTARFQGPSGIAIDDAGNVYVADRDNHTVRKITAAGVVTTLAGTAGVAGNVDGTGAAASFRNPSAIAVDKDGNVYVGSDGNTDPSYISGVVRKITPNGVVSTLAGNVANTIGSVDGIGTAAGFSRISALAVDSQGNVYTTEGPSHAVRKITPAGAVTTFAGSISGFGSKDGNGQEAQFMYPAGLAIDSSGNIYMADTGTTSIRKITPTGVVTTLAGIARNIDLADGSGNAAGLADPGKVAVDGLGNVYFADSYTIRKVTPAGVVTTLAGNPLGGGGSVDGTGTSASFPYISGIAADAIGNVYVSEITTIRKITPEGVVTTLAGSAHPDYTLPFDGTGAAARFSYLTGLAIDGAGNLYAADNVTVRKITPSGVVTTLAGQPSVYGASDGPGAKASFANLGGIAVDRAGNVYVSDQVAWFACALSCDTKPIVNNTIRKITADGVVSTLAGAPGNSGSLDGKGAAASFNLPAEMTVDDRGNVFVSDMANNLLRKITPDGTVTTVAGKRGSFGIALGALPGSLNAIKGLAIDSKGVLYATSENAVLKLTLN
jgi:sugar lactone lactonase YvrE